METNQWRLTTSSPPTQERLRKAQMIRDERKITELKARIQEVREREAEIEKEDDERNLKEEEEEKRKVDQLNKLSEFEKCGP